ncbi:hypothetical protein [Vulcanisaeta sp. JCM 16161]|uniref:hypothetical protein n=1 Tax=Vulcanisaeta sp. JCM 16161 TaxID=1295372 RepID=UPI0006D148A9|nr:hypothetical protein [Vulcanisaeta sp. JCM 16161]
MKLLSGLFNRYCGVLGIRDAAMLIYSNMLNNAAYDVMRFVLAILGFDTMNIFGVALVYISYALSSMAQLLGGVIIDVLGRERRALVVSNFLMALLYIVASIVLFIMEINALSLMLALVIIIIGVSMYWAMGTMRGALIKVLLNNDAEKIRLYASLNNMLRSLTSVILAVISGYLLFLNIYTARYLILSSATLSIMALIPLTLMRHHVESWINLVPRLLGRLH